MKTAHQEDNLVGLEPVRHLYVHIPFCARICPYCAFYKDHMDRFQTDRFCEAILAEIEQHRATISLSLETIFFGGGTPTALSTESLRRLLQGFHEQLNLASLREWTIEANPGSVSPRKAALLRDLGVNRISLGVQSWDDQLLQVLGREHNAAQAEESFHVFRDAGFANISIDLMFGLPGQTQEQWQTTLAKTISLRPDHISTYCLTYEEDTDFFLRHARGELQSDVDTEADFFQIAMTTIEAAGYRHYEISNYARPGFESVHNQAYWSGTDYLGIGPSAFSTLGFSRLQNVCDYRAYADQVLAGQSPIVSTEPLTVDAKRAERIALMLRTTHGIPRALVSANQATTQEFLDLGLLVESNGHFILTRAGKSLADTVAEALI
jgi:oxygen-independent coproporphyrinogen III oxidase